jgi:hypothetical protein
MGQYIYEDEISELLRNAHTINKNDVYNYIGKDLETEFDEYFNFCLSNLREECGMFNIQPSFFYFHDSNYPKAVAITTTPPNKSYIIRVYKGILTNLHDLFLQPTIASKIISKYIALQSVSATPINRLMFQYSTLFTYYHELAHLIQRSDYTNTTSIEEISNQQGSEDKQQHIREIDADYFAASNLAQHICQYWDEIRQYDPSVSNNQLYELVVISMASINCYLAYSLETFQKEIYFYENSHPHTVNRLLLILGVINDYIKNHLEITTEDATLMTLSTIDLAYDILQHLEQEHLVESWRDKVSLNMEKIIEYGKEMTVEMGKKPTLASVRILNLQLPNHNN